MSDAATFTDLVDLARGRELSAEGLTRQACLQATRSFYEERRARIREGHAEKSGSHVVHDLSDLADEMLRGVFGFAVASLGTRRHVLSRIALCALGGYGRGELSPHSDLDVCLLHEGESKIQVESLSEYLVPFLWDIGCRIGFVTRTIDETLELARRDMTAYTSLLESRLIAGESSVFARIKLSLRDLQTPDLYEEFVRVKLHERFEKISDEDKELYRPEPNVKEGAGGLRDFHTAIWLFTMAHGAHNIDEVVAQGLILPEEHIEFVTALDFLWRIRNELHFEHNDAQDVLTFAGQRHLAQALNYFEDGAPKVDLFMQDYYAAARNLRRFLRIAARSHHKAAPGLPESGEGDMGAGMAIRDRELYVGLNDSGWFAHYPPRLMQVFWLCALRRVNLSRSTERLVKANLHIVGAAFRENEVIRRLFVAICNMPFEAGHALRQAAHTGFLAAYLPEFGAVTSVIRYENFHHYPVDEHTLRAIEAFALLPDMDGSVGRCLREALEHLSDPYVLVLALLFHDFGKAEGEVHVKASARMTREICRRIGLPAEDEERIAFLVDNHLLMSNVSQFHDTDDPFTVESFTGTVRDEQRLRTLFLLTFADMFAVGPNVWNDWKGALLMQLYLKAMKRLTGRAQTVGEKYWKSAKALAVAEAVAPERASEVKSHLRGLGQRYFVAFSPQQMAEHMACITAAQETGLAICCTAHENLGLSEVVICTKDRPGLFSSIAGCFSSQLIDVTSAALFTRSDGYVVDCFNVNDARGRRPLTPGQVRKIEHVLRRVIVEGQDVREEVEKARRQLFALLQPRLPVRTKVTFDNNSAKRHTVIDIEAGDRTGLLYDITHAMSSTGLDIAQARIMTDVRRVRDCFYVSLNGGKVFEEEQQEQIRERIYSAIHPRSTKDKGDS